MNKAIIMSISVAGLIVASGAAIAKDDERTPPAPRAERGEHFAKMDADGDGKISAAEFKGADHPRMMGVDADGDSRITKAEAEAHHAERLERMAEHMEAKRERAEERVERAQDRLIEAEERSAAGKAGWQEHFAKVDSNGDGTIDEDEMAAQKAAHFAEMDADGDGFLTKKEMRKGMRSKRGEHGDRGYRRAPKSDERGE